MEKENISTRMDVIMNKIKNLRENLGYSFQDLSEITGISKSTLQRYETGNIKNIPMDKFEILANALKTTPYKLMSWDNGNNFLLSEKEKKIISIYRKLPTEKQNEVLNYANYQLSQVKIKDNIINLNKEESYEPTTIAAHLDNNKLEQADIDAIEEAKQFVKGLKEDE